MLNYRWFKHGVFFCVWSHKYSVTFSVQNFTYTIINRSKFGYGLINIRIILNIESHI